MSKVSYNILKQFDVDSFHFDKDTGHGKPAKIASDFLIKKFDISIAIYDAKTFIVFDILFPDKISRKITISHMCDYDLSSSNDLVEALTEAIKNTWENVLNLE